MRPIRRAALTYVAYFAAVGAAFPYLPVYYHSLGLGLGTIGLVTATYSGVQLVGAPAWGALADRFHRSRLTLPFAAMVATGGALLLAGADNVAGVLAAATILAFGLSGIGPVLDSRTLEILGPDRIRYGQLRAWGSLSFVVVALAVGVLLDREGTHALFWVYVPALVLTALIAGTLPRSGSSRSVSVLRGAMGILRDREMRVFLFAVLLVFIALNAVAAFYSIALVALGGNDSGVGAVWALGAIVEVPVMYAYPRLARRFGSGRLLVLGAAMFALRSALAALARDPVALILIAPVEGLGYGLFFVGGVDFVSHRAPRGLSATAQGLYTATGGLSAIVGAATGGAIAAAFSIQWLFAACAAIGVVGAVVIGYAVSREAPVAAGSLAGRAAGAARTD
ncbi:MAG TPA: MFS transporter [Candidatus Limnocylindrales bacterium]